MVVAGIGNSLRKDDSVGIRIVRDLRNKVAPSVYLIECETVPESFIEPIIQYNPTHILLIDAALLNLEPGSSKLVAMSQLMKYPAISTHTLPLRIFCEYLGRTLDVEIALLLIQPGDTSFGEDLTAEVQKTAEHLTSFLSRLLS